MISAFFFIVLEPVHDLDQGMQRWAETGEKAQCTRST
jgi:hypothetical protein